MSAGPRSRRPCSVFRSGAQTVLQKCTRSFRGSQRTLFLPQCEVPAKQNLNRGCTEGWFIGEAVRRRGAETGKLGRTAVQGSAAGRRAQSCWEAAGNTPAAGAPGAPPPRPSVLCSSIFLHIRCSQADRPGGLVQGVR